MPKFQINDRVRLTRLDGLDHSELQLGDEGTVTEVKEEDVTWPYSVRFDRFAEDGGQIVDAMSTDQIELVETTRYYSTLPGIPRSAISVDLVEVTVGTETYFGISAPGGVFTLVNDSAALRQWFAPKGGTK
jgi:hypothetical protein